MIVVRLKGGLGNQMFQYALGRVLSLKNNSELLLDTTFFNQNFPANALREYNLKSFNIHARVANKSEIPIVYRNFNNRFAIKIIFLIKKILGTKGVEKGFKFDKNLLELKGSIFLDGYFQSYKYFDAYKEIIKKDFILNNQSDEFKNKVIEIENQNSVCMHVRRGDYVGNKMHEVADLSYYKKSLSILSEKIKIEKICIFSDEIKWCKENFKFDGDYVFMERGASDVEDLILMSSCKHFILANSSFSWWSAWLASNPNKIIVCPKQWFGDSTIDTSDLIPSKWIRI